MKPNPTRLLPILMAAVLTGAPAMAQDAVPAADAPARESRSGPTAPEDGDDDDAAPTDAAAGIHEAKGKFDYGLAGLLSSDNRADLAPLTMAAGPPVASGDYTLSSGGYYRIDINADGSQELGLSGGDFFRAIWVNEIVVNGIEIRPTGVHSLEFDEAGTASTSFVAILPGRYTLSIPGARGDTQRAVFTIR